MPHPRPISPLRHLRSRKRLGRIWPLAGLLALASARAASAPVLNQIVVKGTDQILSDLITVNLPVSQGSPLSQVDLKAIDRTTLGLGFFKSVQDQLVSQNGKNVLIITVVNNPTIRNVVVQAGSFIAASKLKSALAQQLNITPGTQLNTARIAQSKTLLVQAYQSAGLPFAPVVQTSLSYGKHGVTVHYQIKTDAKITKILATKNTVLSNAQIRSALQPLANARHFRAKLYDQALQALFADYSQLGYQGSGPALNRVRLRNGVLTIPMRELRIVAVDTSALGLGVYGHLRLGSLFNTKEINAALKAIGDSLKRYVKVRFSQDPNDPAGVDVRFVPSAQATGPIRRVVIEGDTVLPLRDLTSALHLRAGDIFNLQLAQQDYLAMRKVFNAHGYDLSTRPNPIQFRHGVLTYHLREVRIAGYQLHWLGPHRAHNRVITRYLPSPGSVFNDRSFQKGLLTLYRTGLVTSPTYTFKAASKPEDLTAVLSLGEANTRFFEPSISYSTLSGLSGQIAYIDKDLFGLGYGTNIQLTAAPNPTGQDLGGQASLTIPWLDIHFLDFRKVPTSLSFSVFSLVTPNLPVVNSSGSQVGLDYSQRATGASFGIGRQLTPDLQGSLSVNTQYNQYYLQPSSSPGAPSPSSPSVTQNLPQDGLTTLVTNSYSFDSTNSVNFPTSGYRAGTSVGYGFGAQGSQPLSWFQLTGGGSTYLGFGHRFSNGHSQQVLAFRLDAGTLPGNPPTSRLFSVGGVDPNNIYTLRGYSTNAFTGQNFLSSSLEYRYNFHLKAGIAQGLYGVAFLDAGDAWTGPQNFALHLGYGIGVELNLGFGSALLPALQFDYGFSAANPTGLFTFSIGPFF